MTRSIIPFAAFAVALAACGRDEGESAPERDAGAKQSDAQAPGNTDDSRPYAGIAPSETIHFTGNEPFWGGEVSGSTLTYSTPETIDGTQIEVERFGGRGGLSLSGRYRDAPFDMAITPGECSDGMSERTYPFAVTLRVEGEQRSGCAWTETQPFTAPPGYQA